MKILAVGNSFYGDDGVGAAVLERIAVEGLFPDADTVDLHTDALALLDHLDPDVEAVIIDAAHMGLESGEVAAFGPDEVRLVIRSDHLSMHGFGLAEAFDLARGLGKLPARVLIVGVEPLVVEIDRGLSAEVARALPRVLDIIRDFQEESRSLQRGGSAR